jgi:hypothetical protein
LRTSVNIGQVKTAVFSRRRQHRQVEAPDFQLEGHQHRQVEAPTFSRGSKDFSLAMTASNKQSCFSAPGETARG